MVICITIYGSCNRMRETADLTMGGAVMQSGEVVHNDDSSQIPFSRGATKIQTLNYDVHNVKGFTRSDSGFGVEWDTQGASV